MFLKSQHINIIYNVAMKKFIEEEGKKKTITLKQILLYYK